MNKVSNMALISDRARNETLELAAQVALKFYSGPLANRTDPEFMVDNYAGDNIDDAYELGCRHGENDIAETIALNILSLKVFSNG